VAPYQSQVSALVVAVQDLQVVLHLLSAVLAVLLAEDPQTQMVKLEKTIIRLVELLVELA
jgi:hypothetical protein